MTSAAGIGLATIAADGTVLDTWYPAPELGDDLGESGTVRMSVAEVPAELGELTGRDEDRDVDVVVVRTVIRRWRTSRPTATTPTCGCTCSPTG